MESCKDKKELDFTRIIVNHVHCWEIYNKSSSLTHLSLICFSHSLMEIRFGICSNIRDRNKKNQRGRERENCLEWRCQRLTERFDFITSNLCWQIWTFTCHVIVEWFLNSTPFPPSLAIYSPHAYGMAAYDSFFSYFSVIIMRTVLKSDVSIMWNRSRC